VQPGANGLQAEMSGGIAVGIAAVAVLPQTKILIEVSAYWARSSAPAVQRP